MRANLDPAPLPKSPTTAPSFSYFSTIKSNALPIILALGTIFSAYHYTSMPTFSVRQLEVHSAFIAVLTFTTWMLFTEIYRSRASSAEAPVAADRKALEARIRNLNAEILLLHREKDKLHQKVAELETKLAVTATRKQYKPG